MRGFSYHHAYPNKLILTSWLDKTRESRLPPNPHIQVGLGGVLYNPLNESILVIKERHTPVNVQVKWKFPGGLIDTYEDIENGIVREIQEETGIITKFKSIMGFRLQHGLKLGGSYTEISDMYIICRVEVDDFNTMKY